MRVIFSKPSDPAENMATDEALFLSLGKGLAKGFLRLYSWSPPSLSFGYFQKIEEIIDLKFLKNSSLGAVRRMTGGRMVFHSKEITFSIGLPLSSIKLPDSGETSFLARFREIMKPFMASLSELGLFPSFGKIRQGNDKSKIYCFSTSAGHSVFLGEKKLIGAAGSVKGNFILVHGSIPISKTTLPREIFLKPPSEKPLALTAALNEFLSPSEILGLPKRIAKNFESFFKEAIEISEVSPSEQKIISFLVEEKYKNLFWNKLDLDFESKLQKLFETF